MMDELKQRANSNEANLNNAAEPAIQNPQVVILPTVIPSVAIDTDSSFKITGLTTHGVLINPNYTSPNTPLTGSIAKVKPNSSV
jgi:hypothetical protein